MVDPLRPVPSSRGSLTSTKLFNLGELRAQAIVDPRQHIVTAQVVRRHVSGVDVYCHVSQMIKCNTKRNSDELFGGESTGERDEIKELTLNLEPIERKM